MIYVNYDNIPSNYKYLCDYGSNYIVLTNTSRSYGESGDADTLSTYVCYFSPSFQCFPSNYVTYESLSFTDISSYTTDNFYYAKDFPIVLLLSFSLVILLTLIFNGFTRLISKGGVVFPH